MASRSRATISTTIVLGALVLGSELACAQRSATIVIATGQEATLPIPTLISGTGNQDVADLLFLRLAALGPSLRTAGDEGFVPQLASGWQRRDSVTLAFDLDPAARWHDGAPVTARDVVFTFTRARNPATGGHLAPAIRHIASVSAEGARRVVITFDRAYNEQLYDAVFHVQPLPAHLLGSVPDSLVASSDFAQRPIGNGPYRWGRRVPGQFVELTAVTDHFLGRPHITRVIFRAAESPEARLTMLLSEEADASVGVVPPLSNLERLGRREDIQLHTVPGSVVGYLLFNQRSPDDPSRAHPVLGDARVRHAITVALNRHAITRSLFGDFGDVPNGPTPQIFWIRGLAGPAEARDTAQARRLLSQAGWRDSNRDGVLDRDGRPLALALNIPATSASRRQMGLEIQEQLRGLGIRVELSILAIPVFIERRNAGRFDMEIGAASMDPTPSGIRNSWSCQSVGVPNANVGGYCDPRVDSLMAVALTTSDDPAPLWKAVLQQIREDAPAAFLYAPAEVVAIHRRFGNVTLTPWSPWSTLYQWTVAP
jgi:peptide/nickel transport system substrate-binding protein